jgi:outer membrane lipase/esterase
MRKILGYSITAAFLGLAPLATMAVTPTYDALTVFGDSYCDVGNLFLATGGAEAPPPYYNGCFSNGPIWLDNVAGFLGVPLRPSVLKRTDYAFGGAWVTQPGLALAFRVSLSR